MEKLLNGIDQDLLMEQKFSNIDEYIAAFPDDIQERMREIRATVKKLVPEVEEKISYGMPAFHLHKTYLVYFAAFKNHIGFYPAPVGNETFKEDLTLYKTGRGSVQFPHTMPIPFDLISKIVEFRKKEIQEKFKAKRMTGK